MKFLSYFILLIAVANNSFAFLNVQSVLRKKVCLPSINMQNFQLDHKIPKKIFSSCIGLLLLSPFNVMAETISNVEKVPLLTKRTSDVQAYVDVSRGFKLLRPFGYNEFEGAGGGYAVKFASLFDVDENVVIGSSPSSADKLSITDYGTIEQVGEKLAKKRNGQLISSSVRETEGIIYYQFEFENPLDQNLPRTGPKNNRPTKGIELYELCVAKGRLWSVQATSNNVLFPQHESTLRAALASFVPRL